MKKIYVLFAAHLLLFANLQAQDTSWVVEGNAASAGNFLGTTNAVNLLFKSQNVNSGLLDATYYNTFFGYNSGGTVSSSTVHNNAFGAYALRVNTSGNYNLAAGWSSLTNNTSGTANAAVGEEAMYDNTTGSNNSAFNDGALYHNTTGNYNCAFGVNTLVANTSGSNNVATGSTALNTNTTGGNNTAVGYEALTSNTTGSGNTAIGYEANVNSGAYSNTTVIGNGATGTASNVIVLGNTSITTIYAEVTGITALSDSRYKKNVKDNVPGLEFIKLLKPVSFTYDISGLNTHLNPKGTSGASDATAQEAVSQKEKIQYSGFLAQDVEAAAKTANYEFSGLHKPQSDQDIYGLNYTDFVVPLVKAVQELSATRDNQASVIDSLRTAQANLQTEVAALAQEVAKLKSTAFERPSLKQNLPNPFNGSTVINYNLPPSTSNAQLTITDGSGRVLKDVALGTSSGPGQAIINVGDLASGTYYYSLVVNGKLIDTKKMILTK